MQIAGHELTFTDCKEVGQGGPEACSLLIDGREVRGRFDPSPLPYKTGILVPIRKSNFFVYGYALCFVDPQTLRTSIVSRVLQYMRLTGVVGEEAEVLTATYGNDRARVRIKDIGVTAR
jgi:hypothetical protein